jgi:hypothetical protein
MKWYDVQSSQGDQPSKHFVVDFLDHILGQVSIYKNKLREEKKQKKN